ncbi:MAG: beta-ketoacyl synthase, partial [Desulfuromonadales bacterium]|nr:beta-ketoacyl synthase [Desulfuromonadales bacterium]
MVLPVVQTAPQVTQSQGPSATPNPAAPAPTATIADTGSLQEALQITRQSMQALQNLQEQTSRLHQQFLAGQESATRSFLSLVEQQNRLLQGQPLAPVSVTPVPVPVVQTSSAVSQPLMTPVAEVAPPVAPSAPSTAPAVDSSAVAATLLAVIAEKTGYPEEMLELEMTLDADLGIDSIKRVEILSALQEKLPEAPVVKPEDLGTLQTLGQIIEHLSAGMAAPGFVETVAPAVTTDIDNSQISSVLLEVIAEKTGYPMEMLEMEMALDTDLGIDSIKRVEILSALQEKLPEAPAVKPEDLGVLQTLGQIVEYLGAGLTSAPVVSTTAQVTAPAVDSNQVATVLLEVIAEKTGYPMEMLEMEMALDTDLGIDSIKRVEILSALQEKLPEAPAVKPEDLGVLQTLGQIVDHLTAAGSKSSAPVEPLAATSPLDREAVATTLLEVIAEKTGYPMEMLDLEMALDTDLGIDSIKRVEILSALQDNLPGAPAIRPEHLGTLQTVGHIVDFLASVTGATEPAVKIETPFELPSVGSGIERKVLKAVPLQVEKDRDSLNLPKDSVVWVSDDGSALTEAVCQQLTTRNLLAEIIDLNQLDALAPPEKLAGLVILAPQAGVDDLFVQNAFRLMQLAGPDLNAAAEKAGAVLATVSCLNGRFGLPAGGPVKDALSGGLAGLAKTAGHEWSEVTCKAFDLSADMVDVDKTAERLVAELLVDGAQEIGFSNEGLFTLKLVDESLAGEPLESPVSYGDVVLVSGGARGVTAEVAIALAASSQATLLLLGRSDEPQAELAWLDGLTSEAEIKKAVIANADGPLKPREIGQKYQEILGNREIRNTLRRIKEAGGQAIYRSV